MARVYTAKINKHVRYYDANKLPRPGIITAVSSNTVVDIRIGHAGETISAATRSVDPRTASSWAPE